MSQKDFEQLKSDIMASAGLGRSEATGFYSIHCPICNDRKRKTGGIKFEHDQIIYNCFHGSCPANTVYKYDEFVPRKFRALMDEFGVKIPVSLSTKRSRMQSKMEEELDEDLYKKNHYVQMEMPDDWVPLGEVESELGKAWEAYFEDRAIPLDDIYFIPSGKYKNLCAIAMFYYDKLIAYQVATGNDEGVKYINITENENVIYFPERIPPKKPIIVEGMLDAKCFPNTVAVLKSKMSPEQAYHLKNCEDWLFLPDKESNNFIHQMKQYDRGKFIVPDWAEGDLNEAVQIYGVMEVAERITKNIIDDYRLAAIRYDLWKDGGGKK